MCHDQELSSSQTLFAPSTAHSYTVLHKALFSPVTSRAHRLEAPRALTIRLQELQESQNHRISTFSTSWQNFPCVSKYLWPSSAHRSQGQRLRALLSREARGRCCWETKNTKKRWKKGNQCSWAHVFNSFAIFKENSIRNSFFSAFLKLHFRRYFTGLTEQCK